MIRKKLIICALLCSSVANSQTLTVAGGQTIRAGTTKHDSYRAEVNFNWKPEIWSSNTLSLSLNHALSIMTFRDKNNVNAISWAPNVILTPRETTGFYPYLQLGAGVAYLSDDQFESEVIQPPIWFHEGVTDMGSHGQFESSLAIGLRKDQLSVRAKIYHYSNANIANKNEGIDVAEFGVSYSF